MKEQIVHILLVFGAIAYQVVRFGASWPTFREHIWEELVPWVLALSAVVIWHSTQAAFQLSRDIKAEINAASGFEDSRVVTPAGDRFRVPRPPQPIRRFPQVQVWGSAVCVMLVWVVCSYATLALSVRPKTETSDAISPADVMALKDTVERIENSLKTQGVVRDALPGESWHFLLKVLSGRLDRRQYLFDEGSSSNSRFSAYISPNDTLTLLVVDGYGEPHSLEVPMGALGGVPTEQPIYLAFNIGIRNDSSTIMSIDMDGKVLRSLVLPFKLTVNPSGKVGSTLLNSSSHTEGLKCVMYYLLVYKGTLDNKGIQDVLDKFREVIRKRGIT